MARTILLLVSLIAAANAGFVWMDDNKHNWSPFQHIKMPNINFPPIPMPTPPRLPNMPQLPNFPFAGFQMPHIPFPKIPTPEEMAKVKPGPNQVYNAVAVKSTSGIVRDKNGNPIKTGGTSILVNDNGNVQRHESGNNPPNLNEPIIIPPMPVFKPIVMHPMLPMQPMKPIIINPIEIEEHQPGDNEHYVGSAKSTHTYYSNVDGVESSGGGSKVIVNVDGNVEKEERIFGQGDKE